MIPERDKSIRTSTGSLSVGHCQGYQKGLCTSRLRDKTKLLFEGKTKTKVGRKRRKCTNISVCMLRMVVLSGLFMYRRSPPPPPFIFFFNSNLSSSRNSHVGEKGWLMMQQYTSEACRPCSWRHRHSQTARHEMAALTAVFETFKGRFLTNYIINRPKTAVK